MIEAFAIVGASLGAAHSSHEPVVLQTFPQLRDAALPPSLAAVRCLTALGSSLKCLPRVSRLLCALPFRAAVYFISSLRSCIQIFACMCSPPRCPALCPPVLFAARRAVHAAARGAALLWICDRARRGRAAHTRRMPRHLRAGGTRCLTRGRISLGIGIGIGIGHVAKRTRRRCMCSLLSRQSWHACREQCSPRSIAIFPSMTLLDFLLIACHLYVLLRF
jgi:hypothetical protein